MQTKNKWSWVVKLIRYILGLGLIVFIVIALPLLTHNSPFIILMMAVTPPPALIIDPFIIIGVYLMATGKFHLRLDITALLIIIACSVGLYVLTHPGAFEQSIKGEAILKVMVVDEKNSPVKGLEVDIGEQPGPPPAGGLVQTDENGIATFDIKPGKYYIFFNGSNFPPEYVYPQDFSQVVVGKDSPAEQKIILKAK